MNQEHGGESQGWYRVTPPPAEVRSCWALSRRGGRAKTCLFLSMHTGCLRVVEGWGAGRPHRVQEHSQDFSALSLGLVIGTLIPASKVRIQVFQDTWQA